MWIGYQWYQFDLFIVGWFLSQSSKSLFIYVNRLLSKIYCSYYFLYLFSNDSCVFHGFMVGTIFHLQISNRRVEVSKRRRSAPGTSHRRHYLGKSISKNCWESNGGTVLFFCLKMILCMCLPWRITPVVYYYSCIGRHEDKFIFSLSAVWSFHKSLLVLCWGVGGWNYSACEM